MFFAAAFLLSALFLAVLGGPLLKRDAPASPPDGASSHLQARLDELERDRASGLIVGAEAKDAENEAKRSALNACVQPAVAPSKRTRLAALAAIGAAPLAAFWIYVTIGAPQLATKTRADLASVVAPTSADMAALSPDQRQAMIETMVKGLDARLKRDPEDADGWRMLARSEAVLGRMEDSAKAWRELFRRAEGDQSDWRGFAEVLLALGPEDARDGEFNKAMDRLLELNPDQPMALYFIGSRAKEEGNFSKAAELWRRLLAALPEDAPVRPAVLRLIAEAENAGQVAPK